MAPIDSQLESRVELLSHMAGFCRARLEEQGAAVRVLIAEASGVAASGSGGPCGGEVLDELLDGLARKRDQMVEQQKTVLALMEQVDRGLEAALTAEAAEDWWEPAWMPKRSAGVAIDSSKPQFVEEITDGGRRRMLSSVLLVLGILLMGAALLIGFL